MNSISYSYEETEGKQCHLTGASRGLGVHIARRLARNGVNLALVARSKDDLERVSNEMQSYGVKAIIIPADLADTAQVLTIAKEAEKKIGPVDILINNAGVEFTAPYTEYPPGKINLAVKVNLIAPMLLTRRVLPGMVQKDCGQIVNISSLAGKAGIPFQAPYGATKAGLVMFSHSLRIELTDTSVRVSVICPGFVSNSGMYSEKEEMGFQAPKMLKPTTPDKVTDAVIRAIKKDIAEIIVNKFPMRPGVVLREIVPGITPYLHQLLGTTEFAREISKIDQSNNKDV